MTRAWNVIPDIHADIYRLENVLEQLGSDAPLAFLGDYIDAGKSGNRFDDAAVLTRVRNLTDNQSAVAVMGNHELNAILFHTIGMDGVYSTPGSQSFHQARPGIPHRATVQGRSIASAQPHGSPGSDRFLRSPQAPRVGHHRAWADCRGPCHQSARPAPGTEPNDPFVGETVHWTVS